MAGDEARRRGRWAAAGKAARALVVAALAVELIVFVRAVDLTKFGAALAHASLALLAAAALLNGVTQVFKAIYWRAVLAPVAAVPLLAMTRYTIASSVASLLAPARAGEALRIWVLRERHGVGVPVSLAAAAGEKVFDLSAMLLLVAPLPWLVPSLPAVARQALYVLPALPLLAIGALVVLRRTRRWAASPWLAGLRLLERPAALGRGFLAVGAAWAIDLAEIALVMTAVGVKPSLGAVLLVLLVINLAISVPVTPGNAGSHELGSTFALTAMGVAPGTAAAFAILYHACQTLPLLLLGLADMRSLLAARADGVPRPDAPRSDSSASPSPPAAVTGPASARP